MKRLIFIFLFLAIPFLNAFSLKDKMMKGASGDFVVTEQAGNYTVLLIRSLSERYIILEEIDAPTINVRPETNWKTWISEEAPGHTAWVSYVIDLQKNKLIESYSHSRSAWLYPDDPNHLLPKLLTLSLEKTPLEQRKKIGPPPPPDEVDHRALWTPPITFEGKKVPKSEITAWSSRWPQDQSIIAGCEVELYFSQFSLPYCIEVRSPHYKAAIRAIDSGRGMVSPKVLVFQQSPLFLGAPLWSKKTIEFHIHCPLYFPDLKLLAMDLSEPSHPLVELSKITVSNPGEMAFKLDEKILQDHLKKGHRYRWVLIPSQFLTIVVYSDTAFEW